MRHLFVGLLLVAVLLGSVLVFAQQQNPAAPPAAPPATPPAAAQGQEKPQQSGATFITHVNLVDVLFTVLDRRNKLVPTLEKQDFKVLDDNIAQEIRYFSKQSDLPLRIGMLLDTSNSIRDRLKFEQDAADNFLFSVLRPKKDEAFLMTFDDEPEVIQGFTNDTGALRDKILKSLAEETGGRAFFPYHVDDLDQSFQDISEELRNQYSLAYDPTNHAFDGRYHKIQVETPEHKGFQVRARRGYYARANQDTAVQPAGTVK